MKVLSIRQPWASLIAYKIKAVELRTWKTNYKGPLAIHASKGFDKTAYQILKNLFPDKPFDLLEYPRGKIIATCYLLDTISLEGSTYDVFTDRHLCPLSHFQRVPYGWVFRGAKPLRNPIPCKGQQGLWNFDQFPEG